MDEWVNASYEELWFEAKQINTGWGQAEDVQDLVADQSYYSLPANFSTRILSAHASTLDLTLSPLPPSLEPFSDVGTNGAPERWARNDLSEMRAYTFREVGGTKQIGIYGPPTVGSTNGLLVRYLAEPSPLVADVDVPLLPAAHHRLIAYKAAAGLRGEIEAEWPAVLDRTLQQRMSNFLEDIAQMVFDDEFRSPTAGLRDHGRSSIVHGRVTRRRGNVRQRF